jgi:pimeloyl-ACP methyl ester carboxylesterase
LVQIGGLVDTIAAIPSRRHLRGWAMQNPSDARLLELGDCWIRYRIAGSGSQTVVMVADAPLSIGDYDELIELLRDRYRIVVMEAPACGLSLPKLNFDFSYRRWTAAFIAALDALKLGPAIFVSPCVSGLSGIGIANMRPDLIRGLVVAQTADWTEERTWAHSLGSLGLFKVPVWGQLVMLRAKHARWDQRLPAIVGERPERFLPNINATLQHGACYCMASAGMYFLTRQCPHEVRPIKQPGLALWGLKDRGHIAAKTDMRSISRLLPNAEVRVLDDVGHWPEVENPAQFARLLDEFVAQII